MVYDKPAFPWYILLFLRFVSVCPFFLNHNMLQVFLSLKWQIPFPPEKSQSISHLIPSIFFHKPLCLPGAPWIPAVFLLSTQECHSFPFWRAEHGCGPEASVDVRWFLTAHVNKLFWKRGMCGGQLCLHLISGDRLQLACSLIKRR